MKLSARSKSKSTACSTGVSNRKGRAGTTANPDNEGPHFRYFPLANSLKNMVDKRTCE